MEKKYDGNQFSAVTRRVPLVTRLITLKFIKFIFDVTSIITLVMGFIMGNT